MINNYCVSEIDVVVTGSSGFLGKAICNRLQKLGLKILGIDILEPGPVDWPFILMDIRSIPESFLDSVKIKSVYHCAAKVPISTSKNDFYSTNSQGTLFCYQWAHRRNVEHFVYVSSSAVYGVAQGAQPITDTTNPAPFEDYGQSKLLGEHLLAKERAYSNTKIAIIRPRTILGPSRLGIFSILFDWIRLDLPVWMLGDGRAIVQFVHIEDVISLILSLSEQKNEGVFLCGGKDFSEMNIALRRLIDSVGSQCKIINLPKSIFEPLLMFLSFVKILSFSKWHYKAISADLYFDLDSTFQQTSWRPKFSNFEILTETYTDYIKNLNLKSNDIGLSPHLHKMNSLFIRIHLKISKVLK